MHNQLNTFNWTNFLIKLDWLIWIKNKTSKHRQTAEIAQSI